MSTVHSEVDRNQVESELAKIVQALGSVPSKYGKLEADVAVQQKREAEKEKNRKFGLAVQTSIEGYLHGRGLHPEFIDRGYDCDLFLDDTSRRRRNPSLQAGRLPP
ncbi:MAG: hypothetical protein QOD94_3219 [Alphaproteobacteria bacterium]|nr:hypothetical protein [Alphaproteobacteria bacterium]